ncbi:8-oxo-dGTP pyrophosphatase MutT (NUDIX family) [Idiomarina fontislapidosi]|uniref:CoA pyrophosphatase n=1 Tax=Idiomarina fontislapidosi TaxID=263723 RepID=A0A432XRR7_9GAMM|nr:CoA pyrophosphatase [Idiomarina fontislapidosi]PYE31197.1 8-oxo-dGTP pyrophosphatase MutT (NUDIX family) [Idiomarina fontislapidosi]RUO51408.1 CoA pyrophosphatase [Idiomarina fontislapidosi]|tara:strand:- start:158 stop:769 length:612 start_codon:yes stop_codon:yes gene_type:complete
MIKTRSEFLRRFNLQPSPKIERRVDNVLKQKLRPAAVMILLVERPHGLSLLLTQRAKTLRKHAGQISFPGGRFDQSDRHLLETALRETEEEIGLSRNDIEVVGRLQDYPVLSYYNIRPFIGFAKVEYALRRQPSEVAEIFEVPLADVLDPYNHYAYRIRKFIYDRVYFIPWQHRNIWGATAGILRELAEHLQPELKQQVSPLN